ncbi:MAG TPA: hypothetical protein PKE20_10635, partial [Promineifilum sp.]|nr:hypothetical protein [Promineifilum sp.]
SWAQLALRIRRQGGDDMMELFRVLPMAAQAYLDEWFESDALKGALGGSAVIGAALGPRSAGSNLMFLYQNLSGLLAHRFVVGGVGRGGSRRRRDDPHRVRRRANPDRRRRGRRRAA